MTATLAPERAERTKKEAPVEKSDFHSTVANEVLNRLGTPSDLLKIKAVNVFDNAYRVNVYRIVNTVAGMNLIQRPSITDSFFVRADDKGGLVDANITKKYDKKD